ncbi:unnamed protein product [Brugia pahangi]|uniref:40S ribosomal protein S12 n=1 Tax=Brugia pahangi TaxID=6280 RepID=A0A0N4TGZ9_BRUPA|nr:unnamed protein product [Brugia pahangi]
MQAYLAYSGQSSLSLFWAKHAQLCTFFPSDVMTIITFSLPIPMKYNLTNALREMAKTMNIVTNSLAVKLCSAPQSIMLLKPLPTRRIVKAEDISDEICNVILISTKDSIMPSAMLEDKKEFTGLSISEGEKIAGLEDAHQLTQRGTRAE